MSALSRLPIGHYIAKPSVIHQLDPRVKIVLLLACLSLIFMANSFLSFTVAIGFVVLLFATAQISIIYMFRALKPLWILLIITFIFHLFLNREGTVLIEWGILRVYEQGVIQGIVVTLRILLLILLSSLLTLTTKPLVLTDGLEKLMSPLKVFRFPAHEIALMISISLRFIPTLLQEMDKIMKAQSARGASFQSRSLKKKATAFMAILIPLFIASFQRADELALAMEARGYRGGEGRTQYRKLRVTQLDYMAISVVIAFGALFLLLRAW
ncbi:energy-coupling factor transporter transmembrane component T family protein [Bacillus horti]|uniref:Energy-coupling factor transport system permease protein n=1 Tax=Caldalkalibacillus horti TaxID=77523 RepID=A0ABT9VYN9_9BACI|nr:energy-coupling factor transporter transmembrane component T [Bacillus horti]MDQ0166096.1 energy-coupling factor transport system permease protein [Bacillus horti]